MNNCIYEKKKTKDICKIQSRHEVQDLPRLSKRFQNQALFSSFSFGVHDLETERGRYARKPLPITERRCKLCLEWMIQAVEDEEHFLLHCPFYLKQRTKLYGKLRQMHYNINETNDVEEFTWLLSQENNNCIHWVSMYIFNSIKTRTKILDSNLNASK